MHYERLLCLPATAANPATQAVVFIWERKKLACLAATYLVLGYALFSLFCLFSGARRKTILCHFKLTEKQEWYKEMCLVTQSCLTVCDPMDCSPPGSSVHESLQARILEWVAISFSRGSSRPRYQTRISCISCITGGFFTH